MKELLQFLISGITGNSDLKIEENVEGDFHKFTISTPTEFMGILIGKSGRTIRMLRNLIKVKATLLKKGVSLEIVEA